MTDDEARDIEAEAEYWRNYRGSGKCLFSLLLLMTVVASPLVLVACHAAGRMP